MIMYLVEAYIYNLWLKEVVQGDLLLAIWEPTVTLLLVFKCAITLTLCKCKVA